MPVVIFWNYFIYYCSFIVSSLAFPFTSHQEKQADYFSSKGDPKPIYSVSPPERAKKEGRSDVKYSALLY